MKPTMVEEREDAVITEKSRYRHGTRRIEWSTEVRFRDRGRHRWVQSVRAYNAEELCALLRGSGFKAISQFGDWDGRSFSEDSPRLIVVGRL